MPDKPEMRVHRNGLTELYRPSDSQIIQAHVIFVHGLFGSPDKTWTKDVLSRAAVKNNGRDSSSHAVFWPRELLPKTIPQATVHTWGYDADIDNFMQPASKNSVYQHARNLLNDLCDLRDEYEDKTIPFIFIAHSLGGLVVKDALNRSSSELGTRIKDIAPSTFAICFLGTPHRGSKLAKSGRRTITLASRASREPNVKLIQALEQNSEILDRIGDAFLQTLEKYGFQISSFCEEKEIRLLLFINMFIVKPDSAKIGHSKEETGTIPADHRNMAKFSSESDTGFSRINKTIKRWVEKAVSSRKVVHTDDYQDCLQSLKIPEADVRYQQVVENHDSTFAWLFDNDTVQFVDWLRKAKETGPAGRLFWITGKPGSGKSTMMKYAIRNSETMDHLKASNVHQWHMIPFFFSDRGSEKQRVFQTMLQEILYQLLSRLGDSYTLVLPLYTSLKKMQKKTIPKWDLATLQKGISEVIVTSTSKAGICLFMDALDEHSGDNEDLCKFFWDLSSKSEGSILLKICLASRPWPVFQKNFQGCWGFAIHDHTENDIRRYVASRLHEASDNFKLRHMAIEDQAQQKTALGELAEDVTSNAQGVFIWVRLVIDELCQGLTDGTPIAMLKEILKNIPHELEDLYARALTKVRRRYAAETHIMLHIVLSSLSPLHIQTLLDCASWLLVNRVEPQRPEAQASRLASRTGGLLEVVNSGGSSIVQFIHQTAKEYIRSHGVRLNLRDVLMDSGTSLVRPYSPLHPMREEQFLELEGPDFLLFCGLQKHSFSASIVPHLFSYAKEVDNKLPTLAGKKKHLAVDSLSRLLDDKSLWQSSPAYNSLDSFTDGPSRVELAISANWTNMIEKYFTPLGGMAKAMHMATLGPFILDNYIDRWKMVQALFHGFTRGSLSSSDPFKLSGPDPEPPEEFFQRAVPLVELSIPSENPTPLQSGQTLLRKPLFQPIGESDRKRMLGSVGAVAYEIKQQATLLTTLISIKSHPLVSESERIGIASLLIETHAKEALTGELTGPIRLIENNHSFYFRSALSLCLHLGSAEWVNMFLEKVKSDLPTVTEAYPSLTHCLASNRDLIDPGLRASLPQDIFGKIEEEVRPISDEAELSGIGWPLVWLGSQSGIVGFPHINRGFCSSRDHQRTGSDDPTDSDDYGR